MLYFCKICLTFGSTFFIIKGNCLDRSPSEAEEAESAPVEQSHRSQRRSSHSHRRSHRHTRSSNHYTRLNGSGNSLNLTSNSSSAISLNGCLQRISQDINHNYLQANSIGSFQSTNGASIFTPSPSSLPDSLLQVRQNSFNTSSSLSQEMGQATGSMQQQQVFYMNPCVQRTADQLTEEEQIKLLKRMALIQRLPSGTYDENKKHKE